MKAFKPFNAPNEKTNLDEIKYPVLASYKLDGIRCIFKDGEIISRSLKQIQNKQLREKFKQVAEYAKENNLILDGEFYTSDIPFPAISSCVMTKDHNDPKAIKAWDEICVAHEIDLTREEAVSNIQFYCFDCITEENFDQSFIVRIENVKRVNDMFPEITTVVGQYKIPDKESVETMFEGALEKGLEGLMLRYPDGRYKLGRGTIKEGLIFKVKPYVTFDAQIIGIIQATVVDPNAEKTVNELGRSVTSKKKEDRILIEKASAFTVIYEGEEVNPVIALTDSEKENIWKNRDSFIGKFIEYKGMLVGSKTVPRHPVFLRFREDKDK